MKHIPATNDLPLPAQEIPIIVGLEIGTTKICAAVGKVKPDGALSIIGVGQAPSHGVRIGEIVDFDTAQKSVREALVDAEVKSDMMIEGVCLGITSEHISSFNNRGTASIPKEQEEIQDEDCVRVRACASKTSLPAQNEIIHSILQHYYVDGQEGILNPVGLIGSLLEADYHIVHGVRTRIKTPVRCVRELNIEVEDVIFSPYATAQALLNQNQKHLGALVIDIGGGTMNHIVYEDGVVKQSGMAAVGGDQINNDISKGLRIPLAQSEKLKIEEGSALLDRNLSGKTVYLKKEFGFSGREIELKTLNEIIHMRMRETLSALKSRISAEQDLNSLDAGIFLTGGTSLLKGIGQLAEEIFEMPVHLANADTADEKTSVSADPRFSTAIGLLIYGQRMGGSFRFRK